MYKSETQTIIRELLEHMGYTVKDISDDTRDDLGITRYAVTLEGDTSLFTSSNGRGLQSLNTLVKKMLERKVEKPYHELPHFFVDLEDYYKRHIDMLATKAEIVANRARSFKRDIELEPMLPYERLIIHSLLSDVSDIATESHGVGRDRHIVVKFQGEKSISLD